MMPLGQLKKGILNPKRYPMAFEHRKWVTANKKCLAVIKNMIEHGEVTLNTAGPGLLAR